MRSTMVQELLQSGQLDAEAIAFMTDYEVSTAHDAMLWSQLTPVAANAVAEGLSIIKSN